MNYETQDEENKPATMRERVRWAITERWSEFVWRLYRKTDHYFEGQFHDTAMHDLLDHLGAPRHPDNDPRRPRYGPYGRLRAYALKHGLVKEEDIL